MFRYQKILLTIELILTIAATIYTGIYSLGVDPDVKAASNSIYQTEAETAKETKQRTETKVKSSKSTKETTAETKKSDTEPETKKVTETKKETASKNNAMAGTGNSSTASKGTSSASTNNATSAPQPSGSGNSATSSGNSNNSGSQGSSSISSTQAPSPATPQTQAPETVHQHNWIEQTHTVYHEATGHDEDVVVKEAWDEPEYGMVLHWYCSTCNADITENPGGHLDETMHGGYWSNYEYGPTGAIIHHDAITEPQWKEDTPAYDEIVSDGWICSSCGATK